MTWQLKPVMGGCITYVAPTYSKDGRFLFVCAGHSVKVISTSTGATLRLLRGEHGVVTGLCADPGSQFQVYTCTAQGKVQLWDYQNAVLLKTYDVGSPVSRLAVSTERASAFMVTTKRDDSTGKSVLKVLSLDLRGKRQKRPEIRVLFKATSSGGCRQFAISNDGERLALIAGKKLYVYSLGSQQLSKHLHNRKLTALAFHPTEKCVATGDQQGQMQFWYGSTQEESDSKSKAALITSTMHWHAHAVASVTFTDNGQYLLSGGEEAVLVIWQLDTGNKQFLPRLGSPILHVGVTADCRQYYVACGDNAIRLIGSATMKVDRTISGLKQAGPHNHAPKTYIPGVGQSRLIDLVVEPKNNLVVLPGNEGSLQFFDVRSDSHVYELDVVMRNRVSRTDDAQAAVTRLEHCAFSINGNYLATVDRRADGVTSDLVSLKFFEYNAQTREYVLNSQIDQPHKNHRITSLLFHPTKAVCITTGALDSRFKVWEAQARDNVPGMTTPQNAGFSASWGCRSVGFYRDYVVRCGALSGDGSVLAVSYGQIVSLWDPLANQLHTTLSHPAPTDHVLRLSFVPGSPYLVACTGTDMFVWNIMSCSVWWSQKISVMSVVSDPLSSRVLVLAAAGVGQAATSAADGGNAMTKASEEYMMMFDGMEKPKPSKVWKIGESHGVRGITFMNKKGSGSSVVVLNAQYEWLMMEESTDTSEDTGADTTSLSSLNKKSVSDFEQVYGRKREDSAVAKQAVVPNVGAAQVGDKADLLERLFSTPSHVIPSLTKMFGSFIDTYLPASEDCAGRSNGENATKQWDMELDDASSEDSDVDMAGAEGVIEELALKSSKLPSAGVEGPDAEWQSLTKSLTDFFVSDDFGLSKSSAADGAPSANGDVNLKSPKTKAAAPLKTPAKASAKTPAKTAAKTPAKTPKAKAVPNTPSQVPADDVPSSTRKRRSQAMEETNGHTANGDVATPARRSARTPKPKNLSA